MTHKACWDLDCGGKLECPDKTQTYTGEHATPHRKRPSWNLNLGLLTVRQEHQPLHHHAACAIFKITPCLPGWVPEVIFSTYYIKSNHCIKKDLASRILCMFVYLLQSCNMVNVNWCLSNDKPPGKYLLNRPGFNHHKWDGHGFWYFFSSWIQVVPVQLHKILRYTKN